jgi:hypothetical protein
MEGADDSLVGAPGMEELSLMLRGFLIRLTSLDGQLEDIKGEESLFRDKREANRQKKRHSQ